MAEREVTLKLNLKIDGNQIPKIDTKLAEQSLRDLEARAKQTGQAIQQAVAAPGQFSRPSYTPYTAGYSYVNGQRVMDNPNAPGAMRAAGIAYPTLASEFTPGRRAPGGFGDIMRRPSDSPYSTSRGGPAYGPVSDPGSYAQSSLQTARGYDVAMLREQAKMFADANRGAEAYTKSLVRMRTDMRSLRADAVGLAASVALFRMSMSDNDGSISSRLNQGLAGLSLASYAIGGAQSLGRTTASTSRSLGRGVQIASQRIGGTSALGRGGFAAGSAITAGGALLGAAVGPAAIVGAAGLAWLSYEEARNQSAIAEGGRLDAQISQANLWRNYNAIAPFATQGSYSSIHGSAASRKYALGSIDYSQFRQ
jgi:hypothetical protein